MKIFLRKNSFFKKKDKILYLPIEIHSREFHSKLYLANEACKSGWTVLLGPKYDINRITRYLPFGVYLGIGFHGAAANVAALMKDNGHFVLSQDEEGLVRLAPKFYKEYRIDKSIESSSDYLLCWGKEHEDILRSYFSNSSKIMPIGNTRVDLLSKKNKQIFDSEVHSLIKEHGEFILINGNFGSANHTSGIEYFLEELKSRGWVSSADKEEYQMTRIDFQRKIFKKMMDLSIAIAKNGHKVIVRPHPSENIEVWKDYTKDYSDKIKIIRSGNVLSWILASRLVIHNGCTTAIEAFLLGKCVISYRPYKDEYVESHLPNAISHNFFDEDQVISYINKQDIGVLDISTSRNLLSKNIQTYNYDKSSADLIIDLISDKSGENNKSLFFSIKQNILVELTRLRFFLSTIINRKNYLYESSKCPSIKINEVKKIQDILNKDKVIDDTNVFYFTRHSIIMKSKS
ncbi:MAG: hypothetical protein CMD72_04480 [Gammaproteobacteria bacterium]|nr:hypothetical protein [Gammaproteobacteria bacterium]